MQNFITFRNWLLNCKNLDSKVFFLPEWVLQHGKFKVSGYHMVSISVEIIVYHLNRSSSKIKFTRGQSRLQDAIYNILFSLDISEKPRENKDNMSNVETDQMHGYENMPILNWMPATHFKSSQDRSTLTTVLHQVFFYNPSVNIWELKRPIALVLKTKWFPHSSLI